MDILSVADIQADVITDAVIFKPVKAENITDTDISAADLGSEFRLVTRGSRQLDVKQCFVDIGSKTGAVKSDGWGHGRIDIACPDQGPSQFDHGLLLFFRQS